MISTILFSLSALCFGALLSPRKASPRPLTSMPIYTYYVGDEAPLPTWQRKAGAAAQVAQRCG